MNLQNQPIRYMIVDDEPLAIAVIKTYADQYPDLKLVQTFTDAITALQQIRESAPDLLFMDVQMPDINGLALVSSLQPQPAVIFTTAHREFAADSYDLDALDYLVKPVDPERFGRAINRAREYFANRKLAEQGTTEFIFVRSEYQQIRIQLSNIIYIESLEDYLKIHLRDGKPVMTLMTMKLIQEKLPTNRFRRIHRSYLISLQAVKSMLARKVTMENGLELPVGESYQPAIQELIQGKRDR